MSGDRSLSKPGGAPFCLVLSDTFDYERMIAQANGPSLAEACRYDTCHLSDANWSDERIWILDGRLTANEFQKVPRLLADRDCLVLTRVVDPYWESCLQSPALKFAFSMGSDQRFGVLSPYQAEESCVFLEQQYGPRFLVSPYCYDRRKEVPLSSPKKRRLIVAGKKKPRLYLLRSMVIHKRRWPWHYRHVDHLQHAGYWDINQTRQHDIIGDRFIAKLAEYQWMVMCAARTKFEFMKYRECAYAGCVPVGEPPRTFDPDLSALIQPLRAVSFSEDLNRMLQMPVDQCMDIATAFRQLLSERRDPDLQQRKLLQDIKQAWPASPAGVLLTRN